MHKNIKSPVTGKNNVKIFDTLSVDEIMNNYRKGNKIDVSKYFIDVDPLNILECLETGYKFYYPPIMGDGKFYDELNKNRKSYYHKWNSENNIALRYIKPNDKVLDIGCGEGEFLFQLKSKINTSVYGTDLNKEALQTAQKRKINIIDTSESEKYNNFFDVIIAFHVLEHVYDVAGFINTYKKMLKKDGFLIIAVPNNNPYYNHYDKYHTLNTPPHHVGMWNKSSLEKLGRLFGLKVILQETNKITDYKTIIKNKMKLENNKFALFLFKLVHSFPIKVFYWFRNHNFQGSNVITVFQK